VRCSEGETMHQTSFEHELGARRAANDIVLQAACHIPWERGVGQPATSSLYAQWTLLPRMLEASSSQLSSPSMS
jgi:hypothetical protein